ncbi:Signal recognition particle receptor FtsY [Candidatus Kinetoplastibacterium sorsogonicusi]|uniref:Signal recognition particle receptor FtsY n=1 Tax=Candidatus Kinetoplastidibacterium kentomonadis TaxID=1576550 RepID=A0A3S7J9N6_9PROT|nr:Signal recognition particle receptor FtsY [Candidatus Kinetoplastibacterium sorsogonicusi]
MISDKKNIQDICKNYIILDEEKRNFQSIDNKFIPTSNFIKKSLSIIGNTINRLFINHKNFDLILDELETIFITSDMGIDATEKVLDELSKIIKSNNVTDMIQIKKILYDILLKYLINLEKDILYDNKKLLVLLFVGINGSGKTTSISKLAYKIHKQQKRKKILLVAGDTFRAAATDQLIKLGMNNGIKTFISEKLDPSSVAFDAINFGINNSYDIAMIDTAGRLHNQGNLMDELKKIKRVILKSSDKIVQETILVIDGNIGQNNLSQINSFNSIIGIDGMILTKLDGTSKGGIVVPLSLGINNIKPIPIYYIGVGEKNNDIYKFSASDFVNGLLGI